MTVISLNIEGLSTAKEDLIAKMCFKHKCSVLCLPETHRGPQSHQPKVNGMAVLLNFHTISMEVLFLQKKEQPWNQYIQMTKITLKPSL